MMPVETGNKGYRIKRGGGGHGPGNRNHPLGSAEETPENLGVSLSPEVPCRSTRSWPELRGAAAGRLRRSYPKAGNLVPDPWIHAILFQPGPEDLRNALRGLPPDLFRGHRGFPRIPRAGGRREPGVSGGSGRAVPRRPVPAGKRTAFHAA